MANDGNRSFLIATPAYGGMLSMTYFNGIISLSSTRIEGWQKSIKVTANESLIQRIRQYFAKFAMEFNYDKLLFIDADIGFTGEDVKKLILQDKPVVGGTYATKKLPPRLNFNPLPEHDLKDIPNFQSFEGMKKLYEKYGVGGGLLEVMHVPTGFLCIDVNVLRELEKYVPSYSGIGYGSDQFERIPEFFPVRIKDGRFESEDWAFCSLCREHGIKIYLDTEVVVSHTANIVIDVHQPGFISGVL
jgi:hypothetical protein